MATTNCKSFKAMATVASVALAFQKIKLYHEEKKREKVGIEQFWNNDPCR